jgi:hypothetical protein
MFSKVMGGMGLMHIIKQNMKIKMLMNPMKYGGVECVMNIKPKDK